MSTALESVRAALIADSGVTASLGARISPKVAPQDEALPYAVLDTTHTKVFNGLDGYSGLDICEVELLVWVDSFTSATSIALACRRVLEAAGFLCIGPAEALYDSDISPPEFGCGWIFRAYQ